MRACRNVTAVRLPTVVTVTDSAYTITGIVKDATTLRGLPYAVIGVDGGRPVATDTAGLFRLELSRSQALPTSLSIRRLSYDPQLHPISMTANAGLRLEIFMTYHPMCLEPVTPGG
jgi:hypothetical protein